MDFFSSKYNENYLDKVAYKGLLDFFLQLILEQVNDLSKSAK